MISKQRAYLTLQITTTVAILSVFVFFRWYQLQNTLLFYNDMGRDYIELLNWTETSKPPLLGPQTSVVSYNQSAWYFYFLFPLFFVTDHWALSSTLTITFFGIVVYLALIWIHRKHNWYFWFISLAFLLLSVHPQVVLQNRFVWNPSFLPYFLLLSLVACLRLSDEFSRRWTIVYWLSSAFAAGFSYSALPIIITTSLYVVFKNRHHLLEHLSIAFSSAVIVLLPLIAFEIRHSLALTKLFLAGQTTSQTAASATIKSRQLTALLFQAPSEVLGTRVFLAISVAIGATSFFALKKRFKHFPKLCFFLISLVLNTFLFLFIPINFEKHYIFPIVVLLFLTIAALPRLIAVIITIVLVLFWSQPYFIKWHTSQPVRSISDMQQCYAQFCKNFNEPAYVSMESGILTGYHNALEHQFFLREAGCKIYNITDHQDQANTMLVIGDNAEYTHGESAYYELTLFGPATQSAEFTCTDNLKIYRIDKN